MLNRLKELVRRIKLMIQIKLKYPACSIHFTSILSFLGEVLLGENTNIGRRTTVNIEKTGRFILSNKAWIGDDCELSTMGMLFIGENTSIQHRSQLHGDISIGANCLGGANLYISSAKHAFNDIPFLPIRAQDLLAEKKPWQERSRPVLVGDDCWFGINVVITPGVTIGRGCVIGANSVVTRDLPPYSVAAGVPAKVIKQRLSFAPLLSIDATNNEHLPYFYAGCVQKPLKEVKTVSIARVSSGLPVLQQFSIVLDAKEGQKIILSLQALAKGQLLHGEQRQEVKEGDQEVCFNANPGLWSILSFNWQCVENSYSHSLIVKAAKLL